MLSVVAGAVQEPEDREVWELAQTAVTFADGAAEVRRLLPAGWTIVWLRVEAADYRPTADRDLTPPEATTRAAERPAKLWTPSRAAW